MSFSHSIDRRGVIAGIAALAAARPALAQSDAMPPTEPMVEGDPNAPVTLIEYASFTCPHCYHFYLNEYQELKRDYIDTGKVKLELREVYFDKYGLWAAMIARCGGKQKYFGFVDLIFRKQQEWARADDVVAALEKIGRLGGLTKEEMDSCLHNNDFAKALVEQYQKVRDNPLFEGTPTLILDGKKLNHTDYKEIAAAIDAKLG